MMYAGDEFYDDDVTSPTERIKAPRATLMIGGKTFRTGDTVTTHMGSGTIISLDPFGDMEIFVKLFTPKDLGSKFWFSFNEVTVE